MRLGLGSFLMVLMVAGVVWGENRPAAGKPLTGVLLKVEGTTLVVGVGDSKAQVMVPTEAETVVMVNGAVGKLGDLKAEMRLTISQVDGLTKRVEARGSKEGK